ATGREDEGKAMSALWPKGPRQWVWFVVAGAAIRHSRLSLYDAIRTFTTTRIALPCQGNVPGLTGMPSHTQSDFRYAEMKKPPALTSGSKLLVMAQVGFWLSPHNSAFGLSMSQIHERCHLALHHRALSPLTSEHT
ncbi:hypothetical protein ACTGDP_004825, partial [Enterobacter kobei]